jgi:hypothetical protein
MNIIAKHLHSSNVLIQHIGMCLCILYPRVGYRARRGKSLLGVFGRSGCLGFPERSVRDLTLLGVVSEHVID